MEAEDSRKDPRPLMERITEVIQEGRRHLARESMVSSTDGRMERSDGDDIAKASDAADPASLKGLAPPTGRTWRGGRSKDKNRGDGRK